MNYRMLFLGITYNSNNPGWAPGPPCEPGQGMAASRPGFAQRAIEDLLTAWPREPADLFTWTQSPSSAISHLGHISVKPCSAASREQRDLIHLRTTKRQTRG